MPKRIVFPLIYKKVKTFRGQDWFFDDGIFLHVLYDEDFGAFYRDDVNEYYRTSLKADTTCLYILEPEFEEIKEFCKNAAIRLKYVLNVFSAERPVILPYAALITAERKCRITQIVDIEAVAYLHNYKKQEYRIKSGINQNALSQYYQMVSACCLKSPRLYFTLERFNSSLTRNEINDKIVDVTICLESLISGRQDLKFKFALFISFIAEKDPEDRSAAFELLSDLYDVRSGIVHGEPSEKKFESVHNNWEKVLYLAKASLNYYILFSYTRDLKLWDQHLKDLVFGKEARVVD